MYSSKTYCSQEGTNSPRIQLKKGHWFPKWHLGTLFLMILHTL